MGRLEGLRVGVDFEVGEVLEVFWCGVGIVV